MRDQKPMGLRRTKELVSLPYESSIHHREFPRLRVVASPRWISEDQLGRKSAHPHDAHHSNESSNPTREWSSEGRRED